MNRKKTIPVNVGGVWIGGSHPICVQSMTDTDTEDAIATAIQIVELAKAGSELVRITVNTAKAAEQVPYIYEKMLSMGVDVPIVGDFHYNGHLLLTQHPECARILAKYRINPGNVGEDKRFSSIVEVAIKENKPVRIGVNWGSLDQKMFTMMMDENARSGTVKDASIVLREALVRSALVSAEKAEAMGLGADKIILSCKVSAVQDLIMIYRDLADQCSYPLHLGLTEAGMGTKAIVSSSAALSVLLQGGIGDTIRVSLTPRPGAPRIEEVLVCQYLLQSMGFRAFSPMVTSCPGCGRTSSSFFRELTEEIEQYVRVRMSEWGGRYDGVENFTLAVMGCIVNGPGESKHANLGISLPGNGEEPSCPVFADGHKITTLRGDNISEQFKNLIDQYVEKTYPLKVPVSTHSN